jgi:hypothetical protein
VRHLEVIGSVKACARSATCLILLGAFWAGPAQAGWFDWSDNPRQQMWQSDPDQGRTPDRTQAQPIKRKHYSTRYDKDAGKLPTPTGPLTIVVSIAKQRLTLFSNGKQIAEAPVSTGTTGHETPMGVFAVIAKARYHESNLYSSAPMPYMERITWSGVALHEGPLPGHAASHGCIRLPGPFAASLFKITKLGARVIIARDPVAPVEIKNARLFVPKLPEAPADVPTAAAPATTGTVQIAARTVIAKSDSPAVEDVASKLAVADIVKLPDAQAPAPDVAKPAAEARKRKGPVQVFVSRKTGRLYVRQDFTPLFDTAVTIADPDKPWGTHVFTAMEIKDNQVRWTAVTIPSGVAPKAEGRGAKKLSQKEIERRQKLAFDLAHAASAAEALDRFEMPKDAVDRISELLAPGSSLIVSDNGLSEETGLETDFVVATP